MCKWSKLSILTLVVAAIWILAPPIAYGASITGTAHNFIGSGWSGGELCVVCHTPHNAVLTDPVSGEPEHYLWNHAFSAETFEIYRSRGDSAYGPTDINHASRRCLGCHDGVTALDAFKKAGTTTIATGTVTMSPGIPANLGLDLRNDHPISVDYAAAEAADSELKPAAGISAAGLRLDGGAVECSTCHDAHGTPGHPHLLKLANTGSALCFVCHDK
jgi:predicted CXXCH cytochrome family protein